MPDRGPARRRRYHHGDLATALVDGGVALLAEVGLAGFSVAALARRLGVSTAAPYRHFPDRDRLLAAVVTRLAADLADVLREAVAAGGEDPAGQLAAAAGAYAGFVARHRAGLDVVFTPSLRALRDEDLAAAGRAVLERFLRPARVIAPEPRDALRLVEGVVALAHGYGALDGDGFLSGDHVSDDATPARASRAVSDLVRGWA